MKTGPWTIVEQNKLLHLLQHRTPYIVVAELLGRPARSCYYQAAILRRQNRLVVPVQKREWTEQEEQELRRLFEAAVSMRQIAKHLVRSETVVRRRAYSLGLYTKPHKRVKAEGAAPQPEARLSWSPHQDLLLLDWVERRSAGLRGGRRPRHDATVAECERRWRDLLARGSTAKTIREAAALAMRAGFATCASRPVSASREPH